MNTPLNATATTAATLISGASFEVPPYQREYSWLEDEVSEFWNDLRNSLNKDSYFLGLIILTEEGERKQVVDGQQRILTLSLLAAALYHESKKVGRSALADRIQAAFLRSIDYQTDETLPRVVLSDQSDNETFQKILTTGKGDFELNGFDSDSLSKRMQEAFIFLQASLKEDLKEDPFKRLGLWTDFITNHLYFAVFTHPDAGEAYRVFEVINTRGRELTTADLLKNYILHQTSPKDRDSRYKEWQAIAHQFTQNGTNTFVQYIRHVVTVDAGHILPKDLFDFIARRNSFGNKNPPVPDQLIQLLWQNLPLYRQMIDPSLDGPAENDALKIFEALNQLGVIAVRPLLLAIFNTPNSLEGMRYVLKLVVRRMVVGNLGTGNVERKFGESANKVHKTGKWESLVEELSELNPARNEFIEQIRKRSFNKGTLAFLRKSIVKNTITPSDEGALHFIIPRIGIKWEGLSEEQINYWVGTIANTFLAKIDRRPKDVVNWDSFKQCILPEGITGERGAQLNSYNVWGNLALEKNAMELAEAAGNVWY